MRRRDKTGGKVTKTQRPKTLKRRNAPKAAGSRSSLATGKETNVAQLTRERDEALKQQAATSEVLKVISSSPAQLEPVFNAILANAVRICEAKFGTLYLREGDGLRTVATHNAPTPYVEDRKRNLVRPPPDSALGQVLKTHRVTQVADITTVKSYVEGDPYLVSAVKLGGYRTIAAVPMLKDNSLIGAIRINRQGATAAVHSDADIEGAITALGRDSDGGLLVSADGSMLVHRASIISLAARSNVPAIFFTPVFPKDGGLMAYGANSLDIFRRAGPYVERILRGAKPGDLPVQVPTKFELVINLKTAKALGLTVPTTLLVRADR